MIGVDGLLWREGVLLKEGDLVCSGYGIHRVHQHQESVQKNLRKTYDLGQKTYKLAFIALLSLCGAVEGCFCISIILRWGYFINLKVVICGSKNDSQ